MCTEGLGEFHTLQLPSDVTGTCSDVRWQLSHLEALVVALHVLLNAQSLFFNSHADDSTNNERSASMLQ